MKQIKLYKEYIDDKLVKGDKVIITQKDGYVSITEYVDFKKSGLQLLGRNKEFVWPYTDIVDIYLNRGYHK